jgi:two-component system sensor histidine kinase SenX3
MSSPSFSRFSAPGSPVLLWLLSAGAALALGTVSVVAWRAADRQRRDGAGAQRQAAAEAAALKAAEFEALLNAARHPLKTNARAVHAPIERAWFTQPGAATDWIFGPWPQPESEAARSFHEATALTQAGRKEEAWEKLQPLQNDAREWQGVTTSSGLPLRPLVRRLAISLEPAASRHHAVALVEDVAAYPSPLSVPLLEEALAALPDATALEQALINDMRHRLENQERLRAALRERREDVARGSAWITTAQGEEWHLDYGTETIQALSRKTVQDLAGEAGFGIEGVPSLPAGWMFHAELDGVNVQDLTHATGGLMISHTRGPLQVLAVAHPPEAFAALDAQLIRQRWLIGGATGFIAAAAGAFLLVLARQRRLNAMMGNFVAAVSHELRAPIGSMGLLAERLSDGRAGHNGDQAHYHRLIRDECRRLSATIGNVLTFSRRQRGMMSVETELTDLTALLDDAVDLMRPLAQERGVLFSTDFPDTPVEREVDPGLIRQAVVNLLDNALKFSPPAGTVRLRLRETDGWAVITVRDEGPGVPPAERTRIFKPFYRSGSELRRETPGIGIGLAIVQAAAAAHGGSATAGPAPGRGAEFTLRLGPAQHPLPSCPA